MKTNFSRNRSFPFLVLILTAAFIFSCTSEDTDPQPTFNRFETSSADVFVGDIITIKFEASEYTDLKISSNNPEVTITETTPFVYEITATTATSTYINVLISNNTKNAKKSVNVNFHNHGVSNLNTVEGIKVDADKSSKIIALLNEPDYIADSSDGLSKIWYYPSKGLAIYVNKETNIVDQIDMFDYHYSYTDNNKVKTYFTTYPYKIVNDWNLNDINYTIELVVEEYGTAGKIIEMENSKSYQYGNKGFVFSYFSNSDDDYTGKKIINFSIY